MESDFAYLLSISTGDIDNVKRLIANDSSIHIRNSFAVVNAAENGDLPMVSFLVSLGVDPSVFNNYAIRKAIANGNTNVIKYLVSMGIWYKSIDPYTYINILDERHIPMINDKRIVHIIKQKKRIYNYPADIYFTFY